MNIDDSALSSMIKQFDRMARSVMKTIKSEADPVMAKLTARVKANVPKDTGRLEESVRVEHKETPDGLAYTLVADTDYALKVHERPPVEGRQDPDGSTDEGGRGRKYFTRVVDTHAKEIGEAQQRAYDKILKREI